MGLGQAVGRLDGDVDRLVGPQRPALDLFPQTLPLVAGHGDEQLLILGLADLINRTDVRIVEGGGRPGFKDESLSRLGVQRPLRRQELQGNRPVELDVLGLIDDTHAAPPDLLEDPVLSRGHRSRRGGLCGSLQGPRRRESGSSDVPQWRRTAPAEPGCIGIICVTLWAFHGPAPRLAGQRISPLGGEVNGRGNREDESGPLRFLRQPRFRPSNCGILRLSVIPSGSTSRRETLGPSLFRPRRKR